MGRVETRRWIRGVLLGNAIFSGGCGAVVVMASARLGSLVVALDPTWYVALGLGLLVYAGALVFVSRSLGGPSWPLWTVVSLDAGWVVGSVILLVPEGTVKSLPGRELVAVVALIVGLFTALQLYGLGRWQTIGPGTNPDQ